MSQDLTQILKLPYEIHELSQDFLTQILKLPYEIHDLGGAGQNFSCGIVFEKTREREPLYLLCSSTINQRCPLPKN